jgi:hypothetical protein
MPKVEEDDSFEKWFWLSSESKSKKTIHSNYAALNHHVFEYVQNLFEIKRSFFNALAMIFNFSKLP